MHVQTVSRCRVDQIPSQAGGRVEQTPQRLREGGAMSRSSKASGPAPGVPSIPAQPDLLHRWSLRLEDAEEAPVPGGWRKVALMAAIAGIGFTILYVIAFLLLTQVPMGSATDEEILAYYGDGREA
jgi:hypothetical protein